MTQDEAVQAGPAALAALGPEDFSRLVASSVPAETDPAVWNALAHPDVIRRTRTCLGLLYQDVVSQLSMENAGLAAIRAEGRAAGAGRGYLEEYDEAVMGQADWRRRVTSFKRSVERRNAFVKSRLPVGPAQPPSPSPGLGKRARIHNREALTKLATAVLEHRRVILDGGDNDTADEALWRHLQTITAIDPLGDELPLAKWLEETADPPDYHR